MMVFAKENIRRLTDDPATALQLQSEGFVRIDDEKEKVKEEEPKEPENLDELSVTALRALAKKRGIKGASGLSKRDILQMLEG